MKLSEALRAGLKDAVGLEDAQVVQQVDGLDSRPAQDVTPPARSPAVLTGTFWAAVFRGEDGEYAHLGTIAYHEHGARSSADVMRRRRPPEWRERNDLVGIRRFRFAEEREDDR